MHSGKEGLCLREGGVTVRDSISQQAGSFRRNKQNAFLAFIIQSIAITIGYFTELRASLTVLVLRKFC